jgi:hypothetical protein
MGDIAGGFRWAGWLARCLSAHFLVYVDQCPWASVFSGMSQRVSRKFTSCSGACRRIFGLWRCLRTSTANYLNLRRIWISSRLAHFKCSCAGYCQSKSTLRSRLGFACGHCAGLAGVFGGSWLTNGLWRWSSDHRLPGISLRVARDVGRLLFGR